MAGWLAAYFRDPPSLDDARLADARRAAEALGAHIADQTVGAVHLLAWRRSECEFADSGLLHTCDNGATVAFVGQCLDDNGDGSRRAAELLSGPDVADQDAARLNGEFAAAVVHPDRPFIRVWHDRFRHYPICTYHDDNCAIASTELRPMLALLPAPVLDWSAVDLFLRCGELIDHWTLLRDVHVLPCGATARLSPGACSIHRYWRCTFTPDAQLDPHELARRSAETLTAAVERTVRHSKRAGVTLSGGLDSRLLLALCPNPETVPAFTWGDPGCRDIVCAQRLTRALHAPHEVRHWNPDAFVPRWFEGVITTAAAVGIHEMYMLPFGTLLADHCDVILNGLAGDAMLGGNFLKPTWLHFDDPEDVGRRLWRWRVSTQVDALVDRMGLGVLPERRGPARWVESVAGSVGSATGVTPIAAVQTWLFENRVFRFTNCGTQLIRRHTESRSPFFDRDVVDLLRTVPLRDKLKHRFYLKTLRAASPAAAAVPWQRTGIPPAWGFAANLGAMGFQRVAGAVGRRIGVEMFPRLRVARPDQWIRGPWRAAAEQLLTGPDAVLRQHADAATIDDVIREHINGADHTRLIGTMLTVEILARTLRDGTAAATRFSETFA